MKMGLKK